MKPLPIALASLLAASTASHAAVIVAWDTWTDGAGTVFDADEFVDDFSGEISYTGGTGQVNSSFSSNDGTFGTLAGADMSSGGLLVRAAAGNTITLNVTNNSGSAWNLEALRFDFAARQDTAATNGGYNSFTVTYTSGGLGPASTGIASESGLPYDLSGTTNQLSNYRDYDYLLSDDLSDIVLADGENALFTFEFSGGFGDNKINVSSVIDNIAITGTVVPEPSAALLGALGCLFLLRRKR